MRFEVFISKEECSAAAAGRGADILHRAINNKEKASFMMATGSSRFDFLKALMNKEEIDWRLITMYHLDEDAASLLSLTG